MNYHILVLWEIKLIVCQPYYSSYLECTPIQQWIKWTTNKTWLLPWKKAGAGGWLVGLGADRFCAFSLSLNHAGSTIFMSFYCFHFHFCFRGISPTHFFIMLNSYLERFDVAGNEPKTCTGRKFKAGHVNYTKQR
jgi:hypothetical protein